MIKNIILLIFGVITICVYAVECSDCECINPDPKFHIFKFEKGYDSIVGPEDKKKSKSIRTDNGNLYNVTEIQSNGTTYFKITNIKDDKWVWEFIPKRKSIYSDTDYVEAINDLNKWILNELDK